MKLEKLKNNHKKKIIIGGAITLGIVGALIINTSLAKYKVTYSLKLGEGVVNYKVPDFKTMAMYIVDGTTETETTTMPSADEYSIIEDRSYCNLSGTSAKNTSVVLKTVSGYHTMTGIKKGDKCYLYFIKTKSIQDIITSLNPTTGATSFTGVSTSNEGLKKGTDYAGTTYYFRGNVTNNWVKFGKDGASNIWWRIIRINGDGSVRIIYAGTGTNAPATTGTGTQIGTKAFNSSTVGAESAGLKYTQGQQKGTSTNSTILGATNSTDATTLYGWYNTKFKASIYDNYIDQNAIFCSDRDIANENFGFTGNGIGSTYETAFGPAKRAYKSVSTPNNPQTPVMTCSTDNQLNLPVGLITYDEVIYAGGFAGSNNTNYYLYTNNSYFTMSPCLFSRTHGIGAVFQVSSDGMVIYYNWYNTNGVRPVINLKADTKFTGNGTTSSPYEVV